MITTMSRALDLERTARREYHRMCIGIHSQWIRAYAAAGRSPADHLAFLKHHVRKFREESRP